MVKTMTEIKKEETTYKTMYQAIDGTEFVDKEECEKYEQSAACVLLAKLVGCEVARGYDHEWLDWGDENEYRTLIPKTQEDIDTMNQLWFMHGGKKEEKPKFDKSHINKLILMGVRTYNDKLDWCWFYILEDIITALSNGRCKLITEIPV